MNSLFTTAESFLSTVNLSLLAASAVVWTVCIVLTWLKGADTLAYIFKHTSFEQFTAIMTGSAALVAASWIAMFIYDWRTSIVFAAFASAAELYLRKSGFAQAITQRFIGKTFSN